MLTGVTALQGTAFFLVSWLSVDGFEAGATALGLASYWPRALLFALPFLMVPSR